MIKHFYSFHVETESLLLEINSLEIEEHEKKHLIALAESQIHHSIIDSILSQLSGKDKKEFLKHLNSHDHDKIWKFLHSRIKDAEEKIKEAAQSIKNELYEDIKKLKGK